MLSRAVILSTCAIVLAATPALPQTVPTITANLGAQVQLAPNPTSMRAALRQWGLDRQSPKFRFAKRSITEDRVEFTDVTSIGNAGLLTTFSSFVISRSTLPGPSFGEFNIEIRNVVNSDRDHADTLTIVDLRSNSGLASILSMGGGLVPGSSRGAPSPSGAVFAADRITITGAVAETGEGATALKTTVGEASLFNPVFSNGNIDFTGMSFKDSRFVDAELDMKFASFELTDIVGGVKQLYSKPAGSDKLPDIASVSFGSFSMSGLTMSLRKVGDAVQPLDEMSLSSLRFAGVRPGMWDAIEFSGFKGSGVVGDKPWQFSLERFAMAGVNTDYFTKIGDYIRRLTPNVDDKTPPAATPPPNRPRRTLASLLPGGPLDGGLASFDMTDFRASAAGVNFDLDTISLRQQKNSAGIVTRLDFAPTQLRLSWPPAAGAGDPKLAGLLSAFGENEVKLRLSLAASFNPATDLVNLETYKFELVDWGQFDFGMTLSGVSAFLRNTSLEDIMKVVPTTRPAAQANARPAELGKLIELYRDLRVNAAQIEVADTGGLDKAVRISANVSNRGATTPPNPTLAQIRETRLQWAQMPRALSGDKNQDPVMRQISLAVARWLEGGGSMRISLSPSQPLSFTELEQVSTMPAQRSGIRATNQPAVRAVAPVVPVAPAPPATRRR